MKYSFTLSRWHKIIERLNTALKEREARIKSALTDTTISSWNKEGVEDKASDIARRAADDLIVVEAGSHAIATIRAALALRNAELGIAAKLAEVEATNRRSSLHKAVIDGQKADMVRPEAVRSLPELAAQSDWLSRRSALAVTLQIADRDLLESLRGKLAQEQRHAVRILDEIADLNREKVEIEMPQEVLEIAGLTA